MNIREKSRNNMSPYVRAMVLTLIVFSAGVFLGIFIDQYRLEDIRERIASLDVSWNDARLLNLYFQKLKEDYCSLALEQNLAYNQKIYQEGLEVEFAEKTNRFTPELMDQKRRYILLQTQFWFNSIELKERCNFTYHNVVYFYKHKNLTRDEVIDQKAQAAVLLDLKEICGNKIMLIPLAADLNLTVIDAIIKQHNIKKYPAIIVDEMVLEGLKSLNEMREIVKC